MSAREYLLLQLLAYHLKLSNHAFIRGIVTQLHNHTEVNEAIVTARKSLVTVRNTDYISDTNLVQRERHNQLLDRKRAIFAEIELLGVMKAQSDDALCKIEMLLRGADSEE